MEELLKEYGAQSLDHNELAAALAGSAIVSGCSASDGTNNMEVDVASGTAVVGGSKVSVAAQTVTLASADGTYPRKDVVYIDSTGSAAIAKGVAEEAEPSNLTGRDTYRPSPEDLSATAAAVVAEVWVAAGVSDIGSTDITDRRSMPNLPSEYLQSHPFGLSDLNNPFGLPAISDMDAAGNDLVDGSTVIWDSTKGQLTAPSATAIPLTVPVTNWGSGLSDAEIYRVNLNAGEQLAVYRLGVQYKGGGSSTSFDVDVYDATNATVVASTTAGSNATGSPIGTSGDGATVLVRVTNSTGSDQNASIHADMKVV